MSRSRNRKPLSWRVARDRPDDEAGELHFLRLVTCELAGTERRVRATGDGRVEQKDGESRRDAERQDEARRTALACHDAILAPASEAGAA